ncbi:MAG: SUMF1/EgtB/PvdO family nonheme iron enzyme [Gemmatimonadota bacterium]|nr:SUMF1/EgtB/PvdO family nonheme iron enzyme [Gemmatimonadota bacterium]
MRYKRIGTFAGCVLAFLICIPLAPSFALRFLGEFSGTELRVDTQIESPAQNNNVRTLPGKTAGDTIQFQLFAPVGGGGSTNGYTVELDLHGRTFSSHVGKMSGTDWTGNALIRSGAKGLAALYITAATVPSTGYLGQVELEVSRALEDGTTLIVRSLSMTSGRHVDQLDVSNAVISIGATSECTGDFDNNGSVDLADFLFFVGVLGTVSSDADYDARMDFDGNGSVNLTDFLTFAGAFGNECQTTPPDSIRVGDRIRHCDKCPLMVKVPTGSFTMGAPPDEWRRYAPRTTPPGWQETPRHRVTINYQLAVGVYEVTRGEFAQFVAETGYDAGDECHTLEGGWDYRRNRNWRNPGFSQDDDHPVVCVNWTDAQAYARWLSDKTGRPYRLPSESEWEYVARAGTTTPFHFGDTISHDLANLYRGDTPFTTPVGSYPANAFGLRDVHGNVWEYTQDCGNPTYDGAPDDGSAWRSGNCGVAMVRGGSWAIGPIPYVTNFRSAARTEYYVTTTPEYQIDRSRSSQKGFRVALDLGAGPESPSDPVPTPPPDSGAGSFNIELIFIDESEFTSGEKEAVLSAAKRWESIITQDLPDVDYSDNPLSWHDPLLEAETSLNGTVDDVRIFVRAFGIEASYAGAAGPRQLRAKSLLPISGAIHFNKNVLSSNDYFEVALHEIGHVLGIGILWHPNFLDLIVNPSVNDPNADTYFAGPLAIRAFDNAGGTGYASGGKVPVQKVWMGHWRESVFMEELMSPYYTPGVPQPLSAITIQALAHFGYGVDVTKADAYRLPAPASKLVVASKLHRDCLPVGPHFVVDEQGNVINTFHGEEE